jgi:septal ring factor EnvC (AmiA/AmiB activator)
MAHRPFQNAVLRDIAYNIRSDHGMPLGKSKRLLDALYQADDALVFRQQAVEREAAQANDPTDHRAQNTELKVVIADLRKQLDTARKQNAAETKAAKAAKAAGATNAVSVVPVN